MNSEKFFKTAGIVLATAVVQAIVFCLFVGFPLPQFTASRDVEVLQNQQLPEQKRSQPLEELSAQQISQPQVQPPAQQVAPVAHEPIKSKPRLVKKAQVEPVATNVVPEPKPVVQQHEQTHVVVVNFDKAGAVEKSPSTPEEIQRQEAREEQATLNPVSDKLADVQAEDSRTEATVDTNQNPTEPESSAAMDSMEKSGN